MKKISVLILSVFFMSFVFGKVGVPTGNAVKELEGFSNQPVQGEPSDLKWAEVQAEEKKLLQQSGQQDVKLRKGRGFVHDNARLAGNVLVAAEDSQTEARGPGICADCGSQTAQAGRDEVTAWDKIKSFFGFGGQPKRKPRGPSDGAK